MTAVLNRPLTSSVPVGWIGQPRLLRGVSADLTAYSAHVAVHRPPPAKSRDGLLSVLDAVGLAGRGGAGYPLASKIRSLAKGQPVVVVNGAEGEPVSAKDHALLSRAPHLVLDGAAAVALATGARRVIVAVTDPLLSPLLTAALSSRPDFDLFELQIVTDRFIAGEARAMVSALNGGAAVPPGRRVLPTTAGVHGQPTVLSNAETFAQVAVALRLGPVAFGAVGTADELGTTLLTVSGAVASPGVLEVPFGVSLASVAAASGASAAAAVVIGGYHGTWLAPSDSPALSQAGLAAAGGSLGAGVVVFVGEQTCALSELARVAQFLADESAKQCGPCGFGLPALAADVRALVAGGSAPSEAFRHGGLAAGRGACAHPDGAVRFVSSGLAVLATEIATHRAYGGCRRVDRGHLALSRSAAFDRTTVVASGRATFGASSAEAGSATFGAC